MKITNVLKPSTLKALFTKAAMVGVVAGAALMAAPAKANAQVAIGIGIGRPIYRRPFYVAPPVYGGVYVAPAYGYYRPYEYPYRYDRWHRRGFYR